MSAAFKVFTTAKADADADQALAYYDRISLQLGNRFLTEYKARLIHLETGWSWHQTRHKSVRFAKIPHFPYLIHFVVNERQHRIRILAVLHEKRKPKG